MMADSGLNSVEARLRAEVSAATRLLNREGIMDYSGHVSARLPRRETFLVQDFDGTDGASRAAEAACALAVRTGLDTMFVAALAHGAAATAELASGDRAAADGHLDAARAPMAGVSAAMPLTTDEKYLRSSPRHAIGSPAWKLR